MDLKLTYYGNPILRQKAKEITKITDEIRELADAMIKIHKDCKGHGISAPQINHSLRIFIMEPPVPTEDGEGWEYGELQVIINPKIISYSEDSWVHSEGCLSIPKLYGDVERPLTIKVEAMNLDGESFEAEYSGWSARVFLHENDHLNGVLYVDRMRGKEKKAIEPILRQIKKKYN